jgi:hypothetical protein
LLCGREADLAAEQIANGVTALCRANHAQQGYYTQAFFGLSIGIERLAKLIIVCDHVIEHRGEYPTNDQLKKIGHDLVTLLNRCEDISKRVCPNTRRPKQPVHERIINCLSEFAILSRYYNLDFVVGGRAARLDEPIGAWWTKVGQLILAERYSEKMKSRDAAQSQMMEALQGTISSVLPHSEDTSRIDTVEELASKANATSIVQKYGRLHTLQIVRWLRFHYRSLYLKRCLGVFYIVLMSDMTDLEACSVDLFNPL